MNIPYLVTMSVMTVLFCFFLVSVGSTMIRVTSMQQELTLYRQNPKQATWVQKYFYGFAIMNGKFAELNLRIMGDKLWSLNVKVGGYIFIMFAICFFIAMIALWIMQYRFAS